MKEKRMTDIAMISGLVTIIFDSVCIKKKFDIAEGHIFNFITALEIAEGYGYEKGVITMLCEEQDYTFVYKYGETNDGKWYQVGKYMMDVERE